LRHDQAEPEAGVEVVPVHRCIRQMCTGMSGFSLIVLARSMNRSAVHGRPGAQDAGEDGAARDSDGLGAAFRTVTRAARASSLAVVSPEGRLRRR